MSTPPNVSGCAGLLLAAGAGTRMGRPKALVRGEDGVPWIERATRLLLNAGCDPVVVVLGAEADAARALLPDDPRIRPVVASDWADGMGASLRAGMAALDPESTGVLITLVDLPRLSSEALLRVARDADSSSLRQARYDGRPGHPVLVGHDHWPAFAASLSGDSGGRAYLATHDAAPVDCGDLGDGRDVDSLPASPLG